MPPCRPLPKPVPNGMFAGTCVNRRVPARPIINMEIPVPVSLEEQLATLARCGISPAQGITVGHLLSVLDRESYEEEPYLPLLITLGGELETPPYLQFSDRLWHFDTECIEGPGSYAVIAHRMAALAGGALPMEAITDYVDLDAGEAWLEFRLDGVDVHWDATVDGDWVDPEILGRFAALLESRDAHARFALLDFGGQDCLLGCMTADQLAMLRTETGLPWELLA